MAMKRGGPSLLSYFHKKKPTDPNSITECASTSALSDSDSECEGGDSLEDIQTTE